MPVLERLVFGAYSRSCSCPDERRMKEERTSVLVSNASRYEENVEAGGRCTVPPDSTGMERRRVYGRAGEDEAGVVKKRRNFILQFCRLQCN
jgi:hypothetical protein